MQKIILVPCSLCNGQPSHALTKDGWSYYYCYHANINAPKNMSYVSAPEPTQNKAAKNWNKRACQDKFYG